MKAQHEVEVKILDIDSKKLRQTLSDLGAQKIFEGELKATFFTPTPHLNLIRVRSEADKTFIQLKHSIATSDDVKSNMEYSLEVEDYEQALKLLELLGLSKQGEFVKKRTSYSFMNCRVEFDKFQGDNEHIPEFLEIESDGSEHIYTCMEHLDIAREEARPWTGLDIISHYEKKNA